MKNPTCPWCAGQKRYDTQAQPPRLVTCPVCLGSGVGTIEDLKKLLSEIDDSPRGREYIRQRHAVVPAQETA